MHWRTNRRCIPLLENSSIERSPILYAFLLCPNKPCLESRFESRLAFTQNKIYNYCIFCHNRHWLCFSEPHLSRIPIEIARIRCYKQIPEFREFHPSRSDARHLLTEIGFELYSTLLPELAEPPIPVRYFGHPVYPPIV